MKDGEIRREREEKKGIDTERREKRNKNNGEMGEVGCQTNIERNELSIYRETGKGKMEERRKK